MRVPRPAEGNGGLARSAFKKRPQEAPARLAHPREERPNGHRAHFPSWRDLRAAKLTRGPSLRQKEGWEAKERRSGMNARKFFDLARGGNPKRDPSLSPQARKPIHRNEVREEKASAWFRSKMNMFLARSKRQKTQSPKPSPAVEVIRLGVK